MTAVTVPILGTAHDAATENPLELTSADLFICVYTDGKYAYSSQQIADIRAHGKGVLFNHERGELDLEGGYNAGVLAATQAIPMVAQCGAPANGSIAIFYSIDGYVANVGNMWEQVADAFRGIRAQHAGRYKVGFYGGLPLGKWLKSLGLIDVLIWLSASTYASSPNYDPNDPDVGLVQQVGTDIPGTDRNLITGYDLGVWWADGHDPTGGGALIGEDMGVQLVRCIAPGNATYPQTLVVIGPCVFGVANQSEFDCYAEVNPNVLTCPTTEFVQLLNRVGDTSDVTITDAQLAALADDIVAKLPTGSSATKQDIIDVINSTKLGVSPS